MHVSDSGLQQICSTLIVFLSQTCCKIVRTSVNLGNQREHNESVFVAIGAQRRGVLYRVYKFTKNVIGNLSTSAHAVRRSTNSRVSCTRSSRSVANQNPFIICFPSRSHARAAHLFSAPACLKIMSECSHEQTQTSDDYTSTQCECGEVRTGFCCMCACELKPHETTATTTITTVTCGFCEVAQYCELCHHKAPRTNDFQILCLRCAAKEPSYSLVKTFWTIEISVFLTDPDNNQFPLYEHTQLLFESFKDAVSAAPSALRLALHNYSWRDNFLNRLQWTEDGSITTGNPLRSVFWSLNSVYEENWTVRCELVFVPRRMA